MGDQELKRAGLKKTLPRMKILKIFEKSVNRHLSAEAVYQQLSQAGSEVSLATVYRVLTQFASAGIVNRHYFEGDRSFFELNQGEHHDHMVCVECGKVDEFVDNIIEERQAAIAKQAGYQMLDHALNIFGLCPQCRAANN